MPKEIVLYMDHQILEYVSAQEKLNHRQMKWVVCPQSCFFVLKHRLEWSNRIVDVVSKGILLLKIIEIEVIGFDYLKFLYKDEPNFVEI